VRETERETETESETETKAVKSAQRAHPARKWLSALVLSVWLLIEIRCAPAAKVLKALAGLRLGTVLASVTRSLGLKEH